MSPQPCRAAAALEAPLPAPHHHPAPAAFLPAKAPPIEDALWEHLPLTERAFDLAGHWTSC